MDVNGFLTALRQDGDAFVVAAEKAPSIGVPTCPDWDMAGLVRHVGGVHRWVVEIVRTGARVRRREMARPEDGAPFEQLTDWYREGLGLLCATLAEVDPEAETWTFGGSGDRRTSWWIRRQACETATHRWDAQHAVSPSAAEPIASEIATEGIDEYLHDFLAGALDRAGVDLHGTLHLHATDSEGEWLVDFDASPLAVTNGHTKADTAVRAPVSDLMLWLNNRLAAGGARLEVFGSAVPVTVWPRLTL